MSDGVEAPSVALTVEPDTHWPAEASAYELVKVADE
jgi:hypothetical protein